jgi:hypothetical protein
LLPFSLKFLSACALAKYIRIKIYKTVILLVILYECETWSHTSREEHRLRVFENRVLRTVFGPKREEVRGGWSQRVKPAHISVPGLKRYKQNPVEM